MARSRAVRRVALVGLGALAGYATLSAARRAGRIESLERINFHGRPVTLAGGPALAAAATLTSAAGAGGVRLAAAALLAGGGSAAAGLYDDIAGARPEQKTAKGFRGHLSALRRGQVTSGLVKIAGVGAAALGATALADADRRRAVAVGRRPGHTDRLSHLSRAGDGRVGGRRNGAAAGPLRRAGRPAGDGRDGRVVGALLGAGVIAGTANLVNLLDLRPGRALKAGLIAAAPLLPGRGGGLVAGPAGAAAALLPADLGEEIMLGDTGANAFGALLGLAVVARTGPIGRAAVLAGLAALTAASERVSFTAVIEATPGLRELDALGRRVDHADLAPEPDTGHAAGSDADRD